MRFAAWLENASDGVKADRGLRMRVEEPDLPCHFLGRSPKVVTLQDGDVLTFAGLECLNEVGLHAEIGVPQQEAEPIAEPILVTPKNGAGKVARTIVTDDNLVVEVH